jgi:hypothetical protein
MGGLVVVAGDADLEMGLRWDRDRRGFDVNLRFEIVGGQTDEWQHPDELLEIDLDSLNRVNLDDAAYGAALSGMVFRPADVGAFYSRAVAATEADDLALHLRLHIDAPARFHAVRWESLRDPATGTPIATRSNVLFSRYLSSPDWRPIPALPQHEMTSLIVVAGPTNVEKYRPRGRQLAAVNVEDELDRARKALVPFKREELAFGSATMANMLDALEHGVDVLYLVCHGALIDDVPHLVLEKPDRTADFVDGRKLIERLSELDHRPTVAMLCSCQSAGAGLETQTTDEGELSALGPRLAASGIAAVVAMQGNVTMQTAGAFAPAFFEALAEHGIVDRAMATARRSVRERSDWWVPVLFSRLRSGRTYYLPAFAERGAATWRTLQLQINTGNFTPVLGPGLADSIIGSREEVASRWVQRWQMPIARQNQGDLAQVAQYLRVRSAPGTVRSQLQEYVIDEISRRCAAHAGDPIWDLPQEVVNGGNPDPAIREIGRRLRRSDPGDPYRVAASLPVRVYVTTGWTDLLEDALRDREPPKSPVTMTFPWNEPVAEDSLEESDPTEERPLVYHLFGRLEDPDSVVLTEDDYFAWLVAWIKRRRDIPPIVQKALTKRSLLFLGYRLDSWDFRVVFHGIKSFGGSRLLSENLHVGVQLSPDNPMLEPEAAQGYLESYFGKDNVSIYWGNTRRFLDELRRQTGLET